MTSVLGPLLFNLYINDLFLIVTDTAVCNFADDTTILAADCQLDKVLERLESDALILSKWFPENFMKLNAGKCHLLTLGTNNLQYLMIEIYKTKHNLNPSFMSEIFETRNAHYDLLTKNNLCIPKARTTSYGIETVRYLGQKLWQTLPHSIRESQSLATFKKELRAHPIECDCKLFKIFIAGLGFI